MSRLLTALAVMTLAVATGSTTQLAADEGLPQSARWSVKADYTDTCSCDATCPCFFGSSPTHGHCKGVTLVEIESGHYEDVRLDGVKVLEVKNVPLVVERGLERIKISTPNTTAEIEVMKGKNGRPIKIENLPAPV